MMNIKVNGEVYGEVYISDFLYDILGEDEYDEWLDEIYGGTVEICGLSYSPSIALYRVDPVAYRCGFNDYIDGLASDIEYELEMEGYSWINGYMIEVIDEDDDEE